ncbi:MULTISPECIES: EndoU domain-containing protein [Bacillus]|uniref:EndoU domain-containing protein n=1 Tax=Bacillus TaxID=1386 RepID=UPI0003A1B3C4|nr:MULTISPECIES: EndoU domain-containing protein [Bacillus]
MDNTSKKISGPNTVISPEMEEKIMWGQRKNPNKNEIIGGHSSGINNSHPNYAVEEIKINPDGTKNIKYTTQFSDGNLSKIKSSTVFPDSWNDTKIVNSVENIGNSKAISTRARDGATWHRGTIDGVEIDVIKKGTVLLVLIRQGRLTPCHHLDSRNRGEIKMYEELDEILSENSSEDSWYDDGFMYAQELLVDFTDEDWKKMFQSINDKSDKWKIRLAYCIDDDLGINGLELLLNMLDESDEVAETTIDSLRSFNSEEYKNMIVLNNRVVDKAQELLEKASLPVQRILEDFLKNIKN